MDPPVRVLLGPLDGGAPSEDAMARLPPGPLAVISAGWQEDEGDLSRLQERLQRPLVDLGLYRRAESLFRSDPGLWRAYRERQDRLIELQRLYRLRLRHLARAARQVLGAEGDPDALAPEQRHAIAQVRALDRHLLKRANAIQEAFVDAWNPDHHPGLGDAATEQSNHLAACSAIMVTGGNVLVLLNRIRLFGLEGALGRKPLLAWSAGAMVMARRVVLFHERSPQGRRDAELLGAGLDLVPGHVFLPDAASRLRTGDSLRLSLLCRRFSPERCLALNVGAHAVFQGEKLIAGTGMRRLNRGGRFERLRPA